MADEQGLWAEDLFDDLLQAVPAGSEGLMLQPYWTPGIKVPGPEQEAQLLGLAMCIREHIFIERLLKDWLMHCERGQNRRRNARRWR